jgi:hypothetical protein
MGYEASTDRLKRREKVRKREEKRWAKKCGPVKTRTATPEEIEKLLKKRA